MNGLDGSTIFTDSAKGGTHIWTAFGNAQLDTAQYKFGTSSALFDGTGDYLSTPDSTDWTFGTDDFTIDCWVRIHDKNAHRGFWEQYTDSDHHWFLYWNYVETCFYFYSKVGASSWTARYQYIWNPDVDTWYHIALVRNGENLDIYVNGTALTPVVYTAIGSNAIVDSSANLLIGSAYSLNYLMNGWMDEVRISKGIARWTSDFIPPGEYS
jgi:hypothetical protein